MAEVKLAGKLHSLGDLVNLQPRVAEQPARGVQSRGDQKLLQGLPLCGEEQFSQSGIADSGHGDQFAHPPIAIRFGQLTVWLYSLPPREGRGVIFSTGTRNSFVVLPLALALPPEWNLAVAVIVIQAFVEMLGMLTFIRVVPAWLLRDAERGDRTN